MPLDAAPFRVYFFPPGNILQDQVSAGSKTDQLWRFTMKIIYFLWLLLVPGFFMAAAEEQNPVPLLTADNWKVTSVKGGFDVQLTVPDGLYVYADQTAITTAPQSFQPQKSPASTLYKDATGTEMKVFAGPGVYTWSFRAEPAQFPLTVSVDFQTCSKAGECFLPASAVIARWKDKADWTAGKLSAPAQSGTADAEEKSPELLLIPEFMELRAISGYTGPADFVRFLQGSREPDFFELSGKGVIATLVIVLLGGLLLNLTPCVLPLIPVNLAMIGASADAARSRSSKIFRGLLYGLGIMCAYGLLGVIAVLTGSTFGAIAGNWIFNACTAVIFLFLGLAMFGVFNFDLSRFGASIRTPSGLRFAGIFLMGALSATLAGACVAPVLAAVLIRAATLYAEGNPAGLLLPFLLGAGMALPWPFAAAGLSLFPRPGAWMIRVKQLLGILIFALAVYYGWLAFSLIRGPEPTETDSNADPMEQIAAAMTQAQQQKKLVLVDFGASWCKNCTAMEVNTLTDPAVKEAMKNIITVRIMAEDVNEPATAEILQKFSVTGLPHFSLLTPLHSEKNQVSPQKKLEKTGQ